ncbi:alpha/beta fold hydrolase [Undibacterium sp. TJN25]|uniref:alpha/beta fold hydrolase n=1 Tax=Undibacterium sp. TJN25 TaxID=3413056 RepID=UPI003BEF5E66
MTLLLACIAACALFILLFLLGLAAFSGIIAGRVEKALPPKGKFIDIDGAHIHYLDEGSGPVIVMIHGLGGQSGHFAYALMSLLSSRFRVIAIDRPGSGHSTRPDSMPARLNAQGDVVAKLIQTLGVQRPLLVGHSLGGAVALNVALRHPESAGGLALIAPLTHLVEDVPASFRALAIPSPAVRRFVAWTMAVPMSVFKGQAVLDMVFSPERPPKNFAIAAGGLLGLRPKSFHATSSDMMAVPDDLPAMMNAYASLALPFAMLYGKQDRVLDWQVQGQAMKAALPALQLELVEGGHMLPITMPEHVAAWISRTAQKII